MDDKNTKDALNSMAAYCAAAERCQSDILKKLAKWDLESQQIDYILERLKKENFLSQERYARAYTNDKYKYAKWGKKKIHQGLYFKGVEQQTIQEALKSIDITLYLENLKAILLQKSKTVKGANDYEKNSKLARFALGRGYEYGDISKVLPDLDYFEE